MTTIDEQRVLGRLEADMVWVKASLEDLNAGFARLEKTLARQQGKTSMKQKILNGAAGAFMAIVVVVIDWYLKRHP